MATEKKLGPQNFPVSLLCANIYMYIHIVSSLLQVSLLFLRTLRILHCFMAPCHFRCLDFTYFCAFLSPQDARSCLAQLCCESEVFIYLKCTDCGKFQYFPLQFLLYTTFLRHSQADLMENVKFF
ncbi:unnamed protein product [Ceratitis capitata]|uniref:(Mediterranean fruit fly) hypothetical protein n=1 Tax=Ceratitis capitata TaxID=7213 RepID=A0A811US59_CERCA|nr:unnamed protein product [Ceratitis capitata]